MRKIAILYPAHFEQSFGGAEIQVKYLFEACLNKGFEIHFIYEDKGGKIKERDNVILHPLNRKIIYKGCGKGWFLYKKQIEYELNKSCPDVIYTRLGSSWVGIAAEYAKKRQIKHIHALASDKDVTKKVFHQPFYPLFSQIETFSLNKGLKNASIIISQNDFQSVMVEKRWRKKTVLINQMTPFVAENTIHKNDNFVQIIWVANFKKVKRPELFVRLAESLAQYNGRIKMIMCGRAPKEYEQLLSQINVIPWLTYIGPLPQEQVFQLMSESHILVNTSEYEGFSNTFVQAWMRKMVIVSMNSNPNNIFSDKKIGFLTPEFDDLHHTICTLLANMDEVIRMGQLSYKYAMENHSINKNMDKIINLL